MNRFSTESTNMYFPSTVIHDFRMFDAACHANENSVRSFQIDLNIIFWAIANGCTKHGLIAYIVFYMGVC